jgi:hypothetical protein
MVFLFLLLCTTNPFLQAQNIQGLYTASELLDNRVEETGVLIFYQNPKMLKHYWFYEVTIAIRGNIIEVSKQYTTIDSFGKKLYADSVTGVFRYLGTVKKDDGVYYSTTHLANKPILLPTIKGQSYRDESTVVQPDGPSAQKDKALYSCHRYQDGEYYVYNEMLYQDFLLKSAPDRLWVNNTFYKRVAEKKPTSTP